MLVEHAVANAERLGVGLDLRVVDLVEEDEIPLCRLAYFKNEADLDDPAEGDLIFFDEIDDAQIKTYAQTLSVGDSVFYEHGMFAGVGNSGNYTITINPDNYPDMGIIIPDETDGKIVTDWEHLTGKTITIKLRFFFGTEYADIYYSQRTNAALGHIETN